MFEPGPSLLDAAWQRQVDVWAVFVEVDPGHRAVDRSWFWRLLKPGFRHVEVWKYIPPGAWLRFDTAIEMIAVEVYADPPWVLLKKLNPTCVRVKQMVPNGYVRAPFYFGPITCVQLAKAFMGVGAPLTHTPYQLYRRLKKCAVVPNRPRKTLRSRFSAIGKWPTWLNWTRKKTAGSRRSVA